jgi:hypothetical protein
MTLVVVMEQIGSRGPLGPQKETQNKNTELVIIPKGPHTITETLFNKNTSFISTCHF